jgi:hypothetical protein
VCEWCGRPFLLRDQRRGSRLLWSAGAVLLLLAVVGTSGLVVGQRLWAPPSDPQVAAEPNDPPPVAISAPAPRATAAEVAPPEPEPTAEVAEYVRVANTGGQGVLLRREPNTAAPRVVARAENVLLRVVGADETVDGRRWRQVEDAQGNRGWAPAEYLLPAPPPAS